MSSIGLSVIGLGKLGACTAACFAAAGYRVTGVDVNRAFVDSINAGRAPVAEPGLDDLIRSAAANLSATTDYAVALRDSDITFLIVPTPSTEDGGFSDRYLRDALQGLAAAFRNKAGKYHLFVITSTVSPGTTDRLLIPLVASVSGRNPGTGFGMCYNPEFIALGSVVNDFLNPDLVLIGENDARAGDMLAEVYRRTCRNTPHIARMSIVSAEITKLSLNSYVTTKISFANTLANLCEAIPGADIDDITSALGADRRIGKYYLKGGLAYGGPCFPRDNRAFAAFARQCGGLAPLAGATDEVNRYQTERLAARVKGLLAGMSRRSVSILGVAYKPNTPVIEESPAMALIGRLLADGIPVTVYDPLALDNARLVLGDRVSYAASIPDCLACSPVCLVMTPADLFGGITGTMIGSNPVVLIDCWRILDAKQLGPKVRYVALGEWSRPSGAFQGGSEPADV